MQLTMINVNSGNSAMHRRDDFPDAFIDKLRRCIAGEKLNSGWSFSILENSADRARFDVIMEGIGIIVHVWVCKSVDAIDAVWESISEVNPPIILAYEPPQTLPWVAVSMHHNLIQLMQSEPQRVFELASLESGVAWALLA